jgi:hypothetical protein
MRKSLSLLGAVAVAALLATSASAGNRGVTFTAIGFIDNPGPYPASNIWSMNPQGTVFMASPTYFGNYCFKWTREGGWGTEIGAADGACRMSSGGTIMAGGLFPGSDPGYAWPGTWAGAPNVWNPIPPPADYVPCGDPGISFYDMGGNGDFATGLTWTAGCDAFAFRWDKATNTTVNLGSPNGDSSRGNAISNDGSTVVGWGRMMFGYWRGARWHNGTWSWIDGQGNIEPKACAVSGKSCTYNGDDPVYGCPGEYADDARCDTATCTADVCVGGPYAGASCTYDYECSGYCVGGPNAGGLCDQDYYCPDTEVCVDNPAWSNAAYKGEARDISNNGYVVGVNYGADYPASNSAYRQNPNGSFTEIPTAPSFPDQWEPARISEDGKTVVGMIGNPWWGSIPAFWNEGTGTQDLQLFLIAQGLDELYFWYLTQLNDVSADGTVMAGTGYDPDFNQQGIIVDLKKMWVCHAPSGHPENARTLGVEFGSVGNHIAHGDFLGTCEFLNSGGLSRAAELRERLRKSQNVTMNPSGMTSKLSSWNGPQTVDPRRAIGGGSRFQIGRRPAAPGVPSTQMRSTAAPSTKVVTPKLPRD